jgi:electron transfer flavoprotein beta subunit
MKLLVCISKTPDTTSKISFVNDGKDFNQDGISFIMNPYDEWYALVRAVELVEKNGGSVSVINVGPASNDIIIRKALAIGADDAVRVDTDPKSAYAVAVQVAEYAKSQNFEIIFTGKETIDYNGSSVGAMIAELLDTTYISYASKLEDSGSHFTVKRDIEGGTETCEVSAPFVLSAAKGLAEQRIPNMKGIMMSKKKQLNVIQPVDVAETIELVGHTMPPAKEGVKMIDPENMDELVRLLHEEAKVI